MQIHYKYYALFIPKISLFDFSWVNTKDRYMAPEVFKHRKYDKKVDVFSFAMILYEVIVVPFMVDLM